MSFDKIALLLVEDNPDDVDLLNRILQEIPFTQFDVTHVDHFKDGVEYLDSKTFDVVLLDLSLPDNQGLEALIRLREEQPVMPVIILTGTDDDTTAIQAVQAGAQDYLVKGRVTGDLLIRAIRYAIERQLLLARLEKSRQQEQQETEMRSLNRMSSTKASVTAVALGMVSLREGHPKIFKELVERYGKLLDLSLEQRTFKVNYQISDDVRAMSEEFGFLRAGPRDVIEVHTVTLESKTSNIAPLKSLAYMEEGRMIIVELMGYLVAFYRNLSLGIR
jgi:DNA-binding response OmpR family regulator